MVRKEYAARLEYDDKPASEPGRFTYSITPRTLVIKDTDRGTKSVAEDLELSCDESNIGTTGRSLT